MSFKQTGLSFCHFFPVLNPANITGAFYPLVSELVKQVLFLNSVLHSHPFIPHFPPYWPQRVWDFSFQNTQLQSVGKNKEKCIDGAKGALRKHLFCYFPKAHYFPQRRREHGERGVVSGRGSTSLRPQWHSLWETGHGVPPVDLWSNRRLTPSSSGWCNDPSAPPNLLPPGQTWVW